MTSAGIITLFNQSAEKLLGYSAAEMIGKQSPAIFHDPAEVAARAAELSRELGRTIDPGLEVFVSLARQGKTETREWSYVRKDGSRFPVLLSVSAMRNPDGNHRLSRGGAGHHGAEDAGIHPQSPAPGDGLGHGRDRGFERSRRIPLPQPRPCFDLRL